MPNLFEIIFVISAIMIISASCIAVTAPAFGITIPSAPAFPALSGFNTQGNLSASYPFDETHNVTAGSFVTYSVFNPYKICKALTDFWGNTQFFIQRGAVFFIIPYDVTERIAYLNGSDIGKDWLSPQDIINNFNGTYSNYIIDFGSKEYECYARFSPLNSYSMVNSWNIGHGFKLRLYGSTYQPPSLTDQLINIVTWLGSIVGYVFYFVWWMIQMMSVFGTLLGLAPVISQSIGVLIVILFIGSFVMFLRGGSSNK